jgi:hypothetical protein
LLVRSNLLLIPTWVQVPSWALFLGQISDFLLFSVSDQIYGIFGGGGG